MPTKNERGKMNKSQRITSFIVLSVLLGIIVLPFDNSNIPSQNENGLGNKNENSPKSAETYINSHAGTGSNFNVTLHQAIVNTTNLEGETENPANRTAWLACPQDPLFNSSITNISLSNIQAGNISRILEEGNANAAGDTKLWCGVYINATCFLEEVQVYSSVDSDTNDLRLTVYNATAGGIPNQRVSANPLDTKTVDTTSKTQYTFTNLHFPLNSSLTFNNKYFLAFEWASSPPPSGYLWFDRDNNGDGVNNMDVYYYSGGYALYQATSPAETVDIALTVKYAPLNATPAPSMVGLKVNGSLVSDSAPNVNGTGYWYNLTSFSNPAGVLTFNITASWPGVNYTITQLAANFTRTDVLAASSYAINVNDANVVWNVTWSAFNFTDLFNNYTINVTLPGEWVVDAAQNASEGRSFSTHDKGNGWQDVKITDAWNGTYWNITAHIANWLTDLRFTKNLINYVSVINSTDIINITAELKAPITGAVNVSIYSPVAISEELNFTYVNASSGGVQWINLSWWDVSNNVTDYGEFRAQAFWTNGTHCGYIEKPLSILGDATMVQQEPLAGITKFINDTLVAGSDQFNLTVYVTDTILGIPINNMNISYNYDSNPIAGNLTFNGTAGYYNLTVKQADVSFGTHTAHLQANNTWFNNQTFLSYTFTFWNQTAGNIPAGTTQTVVNGVNATFNALYQFSDGSASIEGAQFTYDISNESFKPFATYNAPYYVVSFNTSLIAGRATSYHLEFNLSKTFNVTRTYAVEVYVLNKTSVRVMAASQIGGGSHFLYNKYNDTYAAGNIVEAYYGASITFGAQYWDLNGSVGIDPTGAPVGTVPAGYFNVTFDTTGGQFTAPLTYTGSGGNYTLEIPVFNALPGDYPGWFQFCNPTAWNATNRNFTLRILPTPTTVNPSVDVQVRQDNYGSDIPLTGAFPTFQANYGADLQIRWRMYNALNGTEMVGTTLNATFGTTTVLNSTGNAYPQVPMFFLNQATGSHNIQLTLNATGYENQTQGITIQVNPCPVIATIEMWQYTYKNGSTNYGPFVGQNISIGIQFINTKNGSYLTTIGQLVINFTGEVNLTAGTWLNGNWFNCSLNASAKAIGSYIAWVNMTTTNYLFQNVTFTVDIQITKSELTVGSVIQGTTSLVLNVDIWETQDSSGTITLTVVASNVLDHAPLSGGTVTLYYESTGAVLGTGTSIGNGQYTITIDPTNLVKNSMFLVRANFTLTNYQESTLLIKLQIYKSGGIPIEWIMAAVVLAAIGGMIALIYVGPVKKGKKRRQDELLTTASAFEDAINLQHILVIYKNTGTCIYFKSFARESIDPDLISGFLSAVSTFGTEMKVEQALDEMKYGDSVLLLNDGEQVRVTLVLSKSPSSVLRANLGRFTVTFEETFRDKLVNWRGQLGIFEGADDLVDNLLNASIILPHEVGDLKSMKLVKSLLGRGVLKVAQQMTSGERKFFFLASLVSDSSEVLKRPPAEILLAIDQMRKTGVIRPIKIEQFKEKTVSPQELQLIRQQVQQLKVPQDQAETMVQALAKMESIEREAALASIKQGKQITTDLTAQLGEVKKVTSPDEAAVEIKNLEKKARGLLKEKDFEKAMNAYRTAEVLAFQWNLKEDASRLREIQLSLEVDALKTTFAETLKVAKKVESKDPKEGLEAFKKARDIAQMLFKRGIASAEKDVVTLTTTIKKMEAATSGTEVTSTMQGTKKDLVVERKELLGQVKALEGQEMWAKLQKVYLRLEQISNELYKMGDMAEAKNVKLYRKQAMKYQDIVSAIQQDQNGGKKPEQ